MGQKMNGRKWTQEEDDYLRANYAKQSAKETAAHLNRSVDAVMARAGKFGLSRSEARKKAAAMRAKIIAEKPKRQPKVKPGPKPAQVVTIAIKPQTWFSALT